MAAKAKHPRIQYQLDDLKKIRTEYFALLQEHFLMHEDFINIKKELNRLAAKINVKRGQILEATERKSMVDAQELKELRELKAKYDKQKIEKNAK